LATNRKIRTVSEISTEFDIPESTIIDAIEAGELEAHNSPMNQAYIEESKALELWVADNRPANVFAALSDTPAAPTDDRTQLLAKLPHLARRLVNADFAALTVANENGRIVEMFVSGMSYSQAKSLGSPPVGIGVLGSLDESEAPLLLEHINTHARSTGFPEGHPDMDAMIGVGVSSSSENQVNHQSIRIYVTKIAGRSPFTTEQRAPIESLASFSKLSLDVDSLRQDETSLRIRAEQAEQAKSEFMSMINHDLKNPVAAMELALETAKIDDDYAKKQMIDDLNSSLNVQRSLIDPLLDMAMLGKSADDYDMEDCYPIDIVDIAINRQKKSTLGKDRTIEADVPGTLPAIRCDPIQIGRVFDNLIANALKYSDSPIKITAQISGTKQSLIFQVIDHGIGVPQSQTQKIFEPFSRVSATSRPFEGLGLGLAICKTIVEAHSGHIHHKSADPESNKNPGSIFEIKLPVADQ
jgi:signal transduction histidine kinase